MKKLILAAIFMALGFCLLSCAAGEQPQQEKAFQRKSFHQLSFELPAAWENQVDGEGYAEYMEKEKLKNSLTFVAAENTDLDKEFANIKKNFKSQDGETVQSEGKPFTVSNMPAMEVKYIQESGSAEDYGKLILIQQDTDVIIVMFYSTSEAGYEDFERMMESIRAE